MKRLRGRTIVLRPDDNGTFVARLPAIPGCHAWGRTPEQAKGRDRQRLRDDEKRSAEGGGAPPLMALNDATK